MSVRAREKKREGRVRDVVDNREKARHKRKPKCFYMTLSDLHDIGNKVPERKRESVCVWGDACITAPLHVVGYFLASGFLALRSKQEFAPLPLAGYSLVSNQLGLFPETGCCTVFQCFSGLRRRVFPNLLRQNTSPPLPLNKVLQTQLYCQVNCSIGARLSIRGQRCYRSDKIS